jgi:peptide/nickel transport system ATP-binding protein
VITVEQLTIRHQGMKLVDIAFSIRNSLALVGMSGSGKSLSLKAMLNMLPKSMDKTVKINSDFNLSRGEGVALIPQNPFTSLNPMSRIIRQFFVPRKDAEELMALVGLQAEMLDRFPAELSGGQLQRVVIAIALSHRPKLLMLDEPTTALDSGTKENILSLLRELREKMGFYMLFVSHDIASVESLCEEIVVLKEGAVVEAGMLEDVIKNPKESYTKALIESNFKNREWRR